MGVGIGRPSPCGSDDSEKGTGWWTGGARERQVGGAFASTTVRRDDSSGRVRRNQACPQACLLGLLQESLQGSVRGLPEHDEDEQGCGQSAPAGREASNSRSDGIPGFGGRPEDDAPVAPGSPTRCQATETAPGPRPAPSVRRAKDSRGAVGGGSPSRPDLSNPLDSPVEQHLSKAKRSAIFPAAASIS